MAHFSGMEASEPLYTVKGNMVPTGKLSPLLSEAPVPAEDGRIYALIFIINFTVYDFG